MNEERQAVVTEALSWATPATPYHHLGRIKGPQGGVDCGMYLYEVWNRALPLNPFEIMPYNPQWHFHRNGEQYVDYLLLRTNEMPIPPERVPLPADIVVWRFGRTFSHGAIVVEWPKVVHAFFQTKCVTVTDVSRAKYLTHIGENGPDKGKARPMRVFTYKPWCQSGIPL